MVSRNGYDYVVNGINLDAKSAVELFRFITKEYDREDTRSSIHDEFKSEIIANAIPEKVIDKIVETYNHSKNNSDDWVYHMQYAIDEHEEELYSAVFEQAMQQDILDGVDYLGTPECFSADKNSEAHVEFPVEIKYDEMYMILAFRAGIQNKISAEDLLKADILVNLNVYANDKTELELTIESSDLSENERTVSVPISEAESLILLNMANEEFERTNDGMSLDDCLNPSKQTKELYEPEI